MYLFNSEKPHQGWVNKICIVLYCISLLNLINIWFEKQNTGPAKYHYKYNSKRKINYIYEPVYEQSLQEQSYLCQS